MTSLPTGTVTFLFTDIEGSTQLAQQFTELWPQTQARHHRILDESITQHNGNVFQVVGDAYCAAFSNAADALQAALSAQRALQQAMWGQPPIKVRIGLHTGAAELRDGDYEGYLTLARAQRLVSMAYGGQVILSDASAALLRGQLPDGVMLRDLGEHRLKGLVNSERLWQVVALDLLHDFPPLTSLTTVPSNLPAQLTSFIGRQDEIHEVLRLLGSARLLTLTGSGGAGKTRLSLEVAADLLTQFAGGAWFVELASLMDASLIPQVVASTLRLRADERELVLETLLDYVREKQLLLILDNCEHLIEACAQFVTTLLRACSHVKVLTSSRESLGVAGETTYRVPSLSTPDPSRALAIEDLSQYDAVKLFVERARAALPSFAITPQNVPAVAQICHRLDGMPLAIELAAARVKGMRVEQISERLDDRFRLLTAGSRTALPRHQTLRAMIDWSYGLLSEPERVLLSRLSIFADGWTLEAAEAICSSQSPVGSRQTVLSTADCILTTDILDLLLRLVDKSLVILDEQSENESRYRMLETIRQYAREKLLDSGEAIQLCARHLEYFKRLSEEFETHIWTADQVSWLSRIETELDNIRAALQWSLESRELTHGLRLCGALTLFWHEHHLSEGLDHMRTLLAQPEAAGRSASRAVALTGLGYLQMLAGDAAAAQPALEEALVISQEMRDEPLIATAQAYLGNASESQGDYVTARRFLTESLTTLRKLDKASLTGLTLYILGDIALSQGSPDEARALYEESVMMLKPLGDLIGVAGPIRRLGQLALRRGDPQSAMALIRESLQLNVNGGDKRGIAACLSALAAICISNGQTVTAVRLLGFVDALLEAMRSKMFPFDQAEYDRNLLLLRAELDRTTLELNWAEGSALVLEQAIELAVRTRD